MKPTFQPRFLSSPNEILVASSSMPSHTNLNFSIGKLKEIPAGRNSIAQLLFNYVIGYKFPTIMRGIALRTV